MAQWQSRPSESLTGTIRVPGDKSISHRALMFGALAIGETRITGLLEGDDVLGTAAAMRALGANITRNDDATWSVHGVGVGGLMSPDRPLDMGNSGTGVRLLMGLVATHPITCTFTGDDSLSARPMGRIIDPVSRFGAIFDAASGGRLPLTLTGTDLPLAQTYETPMASAQVKSAVLLAGLNTPGVTRVIERQATRDHTERMLKAFGADLTVTERADGGREIALRGEAELTPTPVTVPGDPSSAAFPVLAAVLTEGSDVLIEGVGMNPLRAGFFDVLKRMGADITFLNERTSGGEAIADIRARGSRLRGITTDPALVPAMVDEFPALFVACACADGESVLRGLGELRVKESDRIAVMARGLRAQGVTLEEVEDGLIIKATGTAPAGGGRAIETELDHRIAMSFLVMGLATQNPVTIDDITPVSTSFPNFVDLMRGLGAQMGPAA